MSEHDVQPNIELIANKQDVMPFELHSFELPTTNVRGVKRAAFLLATGGALLTACGASEINNDSQLISTDNTEQIANTTTQTTGTTTPTTREVASSTAVEELIKNVYNNPNGIFECIDEGQATGTMRVVELSDGTDAVGEVNLSNLDVDSTKLDQDYRISTDAVSNRMTSDRNDSDAMAQELFATWCEQPAALAAAAIREANMVFDGIVIGERVEFLKQLVGLTVEDINDLAIELTLPHTDAMITQKQHDENLAVNNTRVKLAENMANAYMNKQNFGVFEDVTITERYGLKLPDALDTSSVPEFAKTGKYIGDVLLFEITVKGEECLVISTGFNVDDQSSIKIEQTDDCDDDEVTTTTQRRVTTTTEQETSTTGKKTTPTYPDGEIPTNVTVGPVTPPQPTTSTKPTTTTLETIPPVTAVPTTEPETARTTVPNEVNND